MRLFVIMCRNVFNMCPRDAKRLDTPAPGQFGQFCKRGLCPAPCDSASFTSSELLSGIVCGGWGWGGAAGGCLPPLRAFQTFAPRDQQALLSYDLPYLRWLWLYGANKEQIFLV